LLAVLNELKEKPYSDTFVFATETGRKIPERTALTKCKAAAAKAGIERVKLHKFRSSFASHQVMSGVLIQDVSRLLGHHSISETEAAYAYLSPSRMQPQVNVICQIDIKKTIK
jgi:integrase/recombinase XerD